MRFVADLSTLAADRAMEESRIELRRETGLRVAQRTLQESQEKLVAWFERELSDSAAEQADRRHAALARFQVESTTCEQQFVHLQQQAAEEFDAGLRVAKRKLEETGWEAEAYFDGNKQIAPKALEEFTIQVDAWRTRAAEEHDKARKLLRRWKQQPPEVVVDQTAFDAAGDDYAGRLPERVGAITAELDRLSALPRRDWLPAGCSPCSTFCRWYSSPQWLGLVLAIRWWPRQSLPARFWEGSAASW